MRNLLRLLFCASVTLACATASAETQKSFLVSADIVAGCSIVTLAGGSWGTINLGSVSGIATGNVDGDLLSGGATGIQMDCTPGTTVSITADTGNQPSGGVRQLAIANNATARIPYELYANGSTTPWTSQAISLSFPVGTVRQQLPVHATATLSGVQAAGTYSDTVHVTVTW